MAAAAWHGPRAGRQRENRDLREPSAALVHTAEHAFPGFGLRDHSEADLRAACAGDEIATSFEVGEDHFQLDGRTSTGDLALQCEILAAYLAHPGWRTDGWDSVREHCRIELDATSRGLQGAVRREFFPRLYGDDPRSRIPTLAEAESVTHDDVRGWLEPRLREDAITVSIVGDVSIHDAVTAAARTFGSLPNRAPLERFEERRAMEPVLGGVHVRTDVETDEARTLVQGVYPCEDGTAPERWFRKGFLRSVLHDRIFRRIRQELGDAYSPAALEARNRVHPRDGWLGFFVLAEPNEAEHVLESCLAIGEELARDGVTREEVDRLKKVILDQLREHLRKNEPWLDAMSELHCRPDGLDELERAEESVRVIRPEDLTALAAEVFRRDRASTLIVRPRAR